MHGFHIVSMALVAAVLNAQQPLPPKRQEVPKPEACIIGGQVVSATTREPLSKANVLLSQIGAVRGESYTTTTTEGGRFALQEIEPGKYRLQATKTGYAQFQFSASGPSASESSPSFRIRSWRLRESIPTT